MKVHRGSFGRFTAALLSAGVTAAESIASSPPATLPEVKSTLDFQPNQSGPVLELMEHQSTEPVCYVRPPVTKWTKELQERWGELARLEANGKIKLAELTILEELSKLRQDLLYPRKPEEVVVEIKHRRLLNALTEAVERYVIFHGGPSKKGSPSKK